MKGDAIKAISAPALIKGTAALIASMLLSGCIGLGVGVLGNRENEVTNPRIAGKGIIGSQGAPAAWLTSEDLRHYWGPPDDIQGISRTSERWQYNFGVRWNGVGFLVAFVPLPLLLPVGHEYIEFTIQNGAVVRAKAVEDDWIAMYGCAASGIPHATGAGCTFERKKKPTRFVQDAYPSIIRVINATDKRVAIAFKHRLFTSREPPFNLEPRQSRNVLEHFLAEVVATTDDGKTLPFVAADPAAFASDSAVAYLVFRDRVFPIPLKYWNSWEAHIEEIVSKRTPF